LLDINKDVFIFTPIQRALNEAKVQYVVVGGLATILHGYPRCTSDVDLVINLEKQVLPMPSVWPG